jgi:tripartite-type tricarboxylate transporter receptor subunit TctC
MRRPTTTDNSLNRREILQGLSAGCFTAGLAAGLSATRASAQEKYPGRPVDFIAPSGPGSGVDQLARFFSPLLEQELKTPFPVLNVTGAVGAVAMAKLLAGRADGYTIGLYVSSMNALVSSGRASWKLADLAPIVRLEKIPSFLFVKMDSPYKTFDELSAAVKAKPDQLKSAILGKGSLDDVTLTYMASKGFKTTIVPFAQPGERYSSILGDHADILYEQAGDVHQFLDSKKIRPILAFNETRLVEFPDIPCSCEKGYEIFLPEFRGLIAKAGTPEPVIKVLSDAFGNIYKTPTLKQFAKEQLLASDSYQPAAEFKQFLVGETENLAKLLKEYNISG